MSCTAAAPSVGTAETMMRVSSLAVLLLLVQRTTHAQLPPSPPTSPPIPPSSRDPDWLRLFERADLLYHPGPRPDFEALPPIENCTNIEPDCVFNLDDNGEKTTCNCTALWWPGLGNGFLGGIAQGATLRIAGLHSGDYGRYTAGGTEPPVPDPLSGFSNKEFAYRASIPAFASSVVVESSDIQPESWRTALNTRDAVYYERSSLSSGGKLELKTYFHRTRRNLIVVEILLDCTDCTKSAEVSLRGFSRPELSDLVFHEQLAGAGGVEGGAEPRQMLGVLRAPENCEPSNAHLYNTNHTVGFVHDACPSKVKAAAGATATVRLLSVLTVSTEEPNTPNTSVVSRARQLYDAARALPPSQLLDEHTRGWGALWENGGIELDTEDLALQQITNSSLYYLLMSTRADWLYSTLVPSTIAASGPKPHGYFGTAFWSVHVHAAVFSAVSDAIDLDCVYVGTRTHSRRPR